MSFLVTIQTSVRETRIAHEACLRLGWSQPEEVDTHVRGRKVRGLKVTPEGARESIYVDFETGELVFDSDIESRVEQFTQAYNAALVCDEARRLGYSILESKVGEDILLTLTTE